MLKNLSLLCALLALTWSQGLQAAPAQPLKVVASFSILADVAGHVAGNDAEVVSLIPPNADPHAFQLTPRELAILASANVVLINGLGLEQNLLESIQNAGQEVNIVVVSSCIEVLPFDISAKPNQSPSPHASADMASKCAGYDDELGIPKTSNASTATLGRLYTLDCQPGRNMANLPGCDPHVWTDPRSIMYWTLSIRDTFSALDPDHAGQYAANAASYLETLVNLDKEIAVEVNGIPAEKRVLITNHETLGYFAHRYGFNILDVIIPGGSSLAEPSARDMAAIIDLIRAQKVPAVFAENTTNPALAKQITQETGASFYTLYTDSLSEAGGPAANYIDYMRYNVKTIVTALSPQVTN